jgi:hypothetical protein
MRWIVLAIALVSAFITYADALAQSHDSTTAGDLYFICHIRYVHEFDREENRLTDYQTLEIRVNLNRQTVRGPTTSKEISAHVWDDAIHWEETVPAPASGSPIVMHYSFNRYTSKLCRQSRHSRELPIMCGSCELLKRKF